MEPTMTPKLAPYLAVNDAGGLISFLQKGLGGVLSYEEKEPSGKYVHAEVRIADGVVMLADTPPGRPTFPAMVHLYVDDADRAHSRALGAGATNVRSPTDSGDGNRRGGVRDAWGNEWWFSHVRKGDSKP
jgi:PhnB protein